MSTTPTSIDGDLFEAARASGTLHGRSAAQQLSHWARLGRSLESSGTLNHEDIERGLAGWASYDALGEPEQAVVRIAWDARVESARAALDFRAELAKAGRSWSELDDTGKVVRRGQE